MTQHYFDKVRQLTADMRIGGKPFPREIVDRIAGLSTTSNFQLLPGSVDVLAHVAVVAQKENPDEYFKVLKFLDQLAWTEHVVGVSSMFEQPEDIYKAKEEADKRERGMWDNMIAQAIAMTGEDAN